MVSEDIVRQMREAAREAANRAYCVYSDFPVGASVLTESGDIILGCNVENASYGLTICAERNAIFRAVAEGHRKVLAVFVYTPTVEPSPPCGACRQVIREFGPQAVVISEAKDGKQLRFMLDELLPSSFGPDHLV